MRKQVSIRRGSLFCRVAIVALVSGLAAACSDSNRLSGNPFSNPFSGSSDVEQTASITPQVHGQQQYTPQPVPAVSSQPIQPVSNAAGGGWTATGGTSITVAQGDSLTAISNRYGVPTNAILSANGMTSPSQVVPGHALVIPVYNVSGAASRVASAPSAPTMRVQAQAPTMAATPLPPVMARAKAVDQTLKVPTPSVNNAKQVADAKLADTQKATQAALQKPLTAKERAEQAKLATVQKLQPPVQASTFEPVKTATAAPAVQKVAPAAQKDAAEQTASLQSAKANADFRWPAKGRVISGFGSGNGNEGINISLPEGTPVRATETGTVTFAGDDVKSYGNLVLIKHDNGYISAYAHNGALNVKRGERVTRGQVIAKSGQSGDVTSPQLHFEIRKGSNPVDPVPYLGG